MRKSPTALVIWLTPQCNLKCEYCFQTHGPATWVTGSGGLRPDRRASEDTIQATADFVLKNKLKRVEFFGGEPLYYRDLFEYAVRTFRTRCPDVSLGLVTNGTLINEQIMSLIEEFSIAVLLSLDGGRTGQNMFRGGYDRIAPWFERLQKGNVSVACQAGAIPGMYENVRDIWASGFRQVFINIIENFGWYTEADIGTFETEYELAILGMLRGEGTLNCAKRIHGALKGSAFPRECGIIREGLACDWEGDLFPCHRAVELGREYSIGSVHKGMDTYLENTIRDGIEKTAFRSAVSERHKDVSFCAIGMIQNHGGLNGEPNEQFCRMIETKHKLVAKHHYALEALEQASASQTLIA